VERRDRDSLVDILDSGHRILERMSGLSYTDLVSDIDFQDVVLYRLMLIGEAARRLVDPGSIPLAGIAWPDVVSLRNRLIHAYDDVDLQLVWTTIAVSLPSLLRQIEAFIGNAE
jgi:uncharacterized protein with HEPN domain